MIVTLAPEQGFAARSLADIAATLPGATAIFRGHKLDVCCRGKAPPAEAVLTGLVRSAAQASGELESRMREEEQLLFPVMRRGGQPAVAHPIGARRHEHDDAGEYLRVIEGLTAGGRLQHLARALSGNPQIRRRRGGAHASGEHRTLPAVRGPSARTRAVLTQMETGMADHPMRLDDAALISHILDRYHEEHRRQLPELLVLAQQGSPGLAELLSRIAFEMEAHMRKEEEGLFPMMLGGHDSLAIAIEIMRDDHEAHLERLDALLARAEDAPGPDAPPLRAALRRFAEDLREHIRLEDRVLFPRFGA